MKEVREVRFKGSAAAGRPDGPTEFSPVLSQRYQLEGYLNCDFIGSSL